MPLIPGILMSVTMTSYRADSIFFTASSPELAVSTLCPSLRRAISRSSRMERSSSHTKTLAMHSLRRSYRGEYSLFRDAHRSRSCVRLWDFNYDLRPFSGSGHRVYASVVGLNNLVDQRQPQSGAALETRLKGLKDFFGLLRTNADAAVFERENPIVASRAQRDFERSAFGHSAKSVVAEVPEDLLQAVGIDHRQSLPAFKAADHAIGSCAARWPILNQSQRLFHEQQQVVLHELVTLLARVHQEIGDDAVQ